MGRRTPFHGRKVVAPLKHPIVQEIRAAESAFHGRKVVAPLKPGRGGAALAGRHDPFHGRKVVAPLKQHSTTYKRAVGPPSTAARSWPH